MSKPHARTSVNNFAETRQALQEINRYLSTLVYAEANTSGAPTDAELVTAFGAAASLPAGFCGFFKDTGGGAFYLAMTDGSSWRYIAST